MKRTSEKLKPRQPAAPTERGRKMLRQSTIDNRRRQVVTIKQAASMMGVRQTTILRLIAAGAPVVSHGRSRDGKAALVDPVALNKFRMTLPHKVRPGRPGRPGSLYPLLKISLYS